MKIEISDELINLFKKSRFIETEIKLIDLNSGKRIDTIVPDEDGYIYIPEETELYPTNLVTNGDDEFAAENLIFITKLINEVRLQLIDINKSEKEELEKEVLNSLVSTDYVKSLIETFDIDKSTAEKIINNARKKLGLPDE